MSFEGFQLFVGFLGIIFGLYLIFSQEKG